MHSSHASNSFRTPRLLALGAFALPVLLHAQIVDPDPELFDGSRTATEKQEEQKQTTIDDWEGANLIVYDSDEEGSSRGGMGRTGEDSPGMDIGIRGPGMGGGLPIPLPTSGGGAGIGGSGLEIPDLSSQQGGGGEEGEGGEQSDAEGGGNPQGSQQGPQGKGGKGGGREPPQKPGEVAIGDDSKRIQSAAAPVGDTEGLEKSADDSKGDGGDDTQMKAASGQQSGTRGGGVEKGDAIPTDL